MVPDRIEREITIAAPVERVWAVVTEAQHVGQWFGDAGAEIDLRPGGRFTCRWAKYGTVHAVVERVEPPQFFSYRWSYLMDTAPGPGTSTLVEFTLTPEGDGTRLRVVESGFRALDVPDEARAKRVEENTGGWIAELDELAGYVTRLAA